MQTFDSFESVSKKLDEQDKKFSNQYDATDKLLSRVAQLERKLEKLEKQRAA